MAQRSRNPRNRPLVQAARQHRAGQVLPQYASRLRLPAAAADRRNWSQVSPCAGRLPSDRGPNADRPFDEPATSTARRVAAATWMMSSTTVASRAYAVVPARRSRGSRGGASRPSSAPAAGSARHRADASRRTAPRAAQTHNLHRAGGRFGVAFVLARLRALDTAGVLGRTSSLFRAALVAMSLQELAHQLLAPPVQFPFEFALAHLPGFAGREEGFGIREDSIGRCARGSASGDRCTGRRFGARRMYVPGILSSQPSQAASLPTAPYQNAAVRGLSGRRPKVFGARDEARLGKTPVRAGLRCPSRNGHWGDASAGKRAHEWPKILRRAAPRECPEGSAPVGACRRRGRVGRRPEKRRMGRSPDAVTPQNAECPRT